MDPLTIGLGLAGLGLQLFGGAKAADVSKQEAQVSQQIAGNEQQIEAQRYQQMQLESNRASLQNFRNVQQIKARGMETAVAGGAQFGSGIAGAQASATSQGVTNALGLKQNLEIGQNIFGYTSNISGERQQLAALGGQAATDQGYQSLGGSIMKAGPIIGAFGKNLGFGGTATT